MPNLNNFIEFLRNNSGQSLWLILVGAFVFGILHTFTPGHGKAIIGTYMAAIRGSLKDAGIMALSTTISHTGVILIIGLLFAISKEGLKLLFIQIPKFDFDWRLILPILKYGSAFLIILFGLYIGYKYLKEIRHPGALEPDKAKKLEQEAGFQVVDHGDHRHVIPTKRLNLKEAIFLGFSSGLTPCADAVLIFLTGLTLNQGWMAFWLLVLFSLGLGFSLTLLGWVIGLGIRELQNVEKLEKILAFLPLLSSCLIIVIGIWLLF